MRTAIYCRVSSDRQEHEQTIQSQLETLRAYARAKSYDVAIEYLDDGHSGSILERPGLDRLRDAAHSGHFDLVLAHAPDRLSRKAIHLGLLMEEMERSGVKVEFLNHPVDDSPEGKMLLGMQGLFAEYERAKIAERARRGRLHWAKQGAMMGGGVPYGYRRVRGDGKYGHRSSLEVDEDQAGVVREAFRLLVEEKLSCRAIAKRLTAAGIRSQSGNSHWCQSSVGRLLRQEAYKGTSYYHRTEVIETPAAGRGRDGYGKAKRERIRPLEEWIAIPVPAIVDEDTWEAAQRQLEQNAQFASRHNTRHQYLLKGLVRCPICGGAYSGAVVNGKRVYRCCRRDPVDYREGVCRGGKMVPADALEAAVWGGISEALGKREGAGGGIPTQGSRPGFRRGRGR
ncbi:MAG: recombinase family protein [Chloroflexota bacterium]